MDRDTKLESEVEQVADAVELLARRVERSSFAAGQAAYNAAANLYDTAEMLRRVQERKAG